MRRRFCKTTFACPTPILDSLPQTTVQSVGDSDIEVVAFVPIDITSKQAEMSLPDAKSMKLDNLLKSGVPLKQLNPQSLLNPVDFSSVHETVQSIINEIPNKE